MRPRNVTVNKFCYAILCQYVTGLTGNLSRHYDFRS
jgi:hypothetical protein